MCVEAIIASSVALSGPLRQTSVCLLAVPIMTLNARFSGRGILVGGALAIIAIAAVLVGDDPQAILREPPILIAPMMLVVAWAMLSTPLMRSDIEHRHGARIDQLTGMLNRAALISRAEELASQSEVALGAVGVIECDIDDFKRINDLLGHLVGDGVLREFAYTLRKHIRAFESAFRLGGEEFLILLPGADLARAAEVAEALCAAVGWRFKDSEPRITASFGVAASEPGEVFEFDVVFARADEGLYEAKATGRNRVCIVTESSPSRDRAEARHHLARLAAEAA